MWLSMPARTGVRAGHVVGYRQPGSGQGSAALQDFYSLGLHSQFKGVKVTVRAPADAGTVAVSTYTVSLAEP